MYTPLGFMKSCENYIRMTEKPEQQERVNKIAREYLSVMNPERKQQLLLDSIITRNRIYNRFSKERRVEIRKRFHRECQLFSDALGLESALPSRFAQLVLRLSLFERWSAAKRVYKFQKDMVKSFAEMKVPETIPSYVMTKLPSTCFYLDYSDSEVFADHYKGTFVQVCRFKNDYAVNFHHVVNEDAYRCYDTCFYLCIDKDELFDDGEIDISRALTFDTEDEFVHLNVTFLKFFVNFCIYLSAINKDVEYTERTRKIYRPPTSKPKNRMQEVEEFGVGFRYDKLSANTTRVRYIAGDNKPPRTTGPKRGYSSNWRSAHWHSYWVNDSESPNNKRKIMKWIPETFVRGNKEDGAVRVTHVVE